MPDVTPLREAKPLLLSPGSARRSARRGRRVRPTGQIELALGPAPARSVRATRRRSVMAPQTRRREIAPEAFEAPATARQAARRGWWGGLGEGVVAMLATLACGLGWAAYELEHAAGARDPLYAPTSVGAHAAPTETVPAGGTPSRAEERAIRWRGEATSATQGSPGDGRWLGSSKP